MDETGKDNVGFSLLTTENPLTVNNDDQEDAEAEEEQRRRQQELQNMMAYAFDDIGDEENSTINSSFEHSITHHNFSQNKNEESSIQNSDIHLEEQYRQADINSEQQMKVLYQIQEREIKRISAEYEKYREDKEKELTQLKRKMLLMENEQNGTAITLKQCQDLLMEKKLAIDEKVLEITTLKDQIDTLTISKRNIEDESQMWRTKFSELEQKMNLIDQGLYVPVSERQIRNKYEQEIADLRHSLEQSQKNLERAIKAKSIAENEIKEIKQNHEIYVLEKEEEVHNLYSQLETSKFQCLNLTSRIESLEKEYQNLTTLLNNTTKEAETLHVSSSMKTIQAELKRSLEDQKLKRDEIIKLEKKLSEKISTEAELKTKLEDLENQFQKALLDKKETQEKLSEVSNLKKEKDDLKKALEVEKSKTAQLEVDFQKVQSDYEAMKTKLEKSFKEEEVQTSLRRSSTKINSELDLLKVQNEQLCKQLEETNKLRKEIELQGLKKIQELQKESKFIDNKKIETLEEENKSLKTHLEELKKDYQKKEDEEELYRKQFEKYENLCLELEKTCAEQKSQLYDCQAKITELEGKLLLKEKRDDLLDDLQQKALMFEQYIKTQNLPQRVISSTPTAESVQATQKVAELSAENTKLKEKIVFDRAALNELTNVWNQEISRLNKLVNELKREIDSKNSTIDKHQKTVHEEMSQMSLLISKLTEALQTKDKTIHDIKDKMFKQQEQISHIKSNYQQKETLLLKQFEKNVEDMKTKFVSEEQKVKLELENFQKRCCGGLEELNDKITQEMKYNNEKFDVETKIIEAYYDLLIQQAKMRKK